MHSMLKSVDIPTDTISYHLGTLRRSTGGIFEFEGTYLRIWLDSRNYVILEEYFVQEGLHKRGIYV